MSAPDNQLFEFESFVLDVRGRILLKDGATVPLTPRAFQTLLVLVQHATAVVDKDRLMKEVWPDIFVEEGNLSRNIYELRKALGDDPAAPRYIETIPKRGYRFIAPMKASVVKTSTDVSPGIDTNATVIETHTFAHVVSETVEGTDLPVHALPISVIDAVAKVAQPVVAQPKRSINRAAAVITIVALVLGAAVGFLLYLKRIRATQSRVTHAKSTLMRLTNTNALDTGPSWSPNGNKIAFASNRDGKTEIYVMDVDGSNVSRLTNNLTDDDFPRWSPDNHKILFHSNRDGNWEIYVMDADGSNQTRLTTNNADDRAPTWSPDAKRIAFASNRDNSNPYNFDIYVMNADGSNIKNVRQ